MVSTIQDRFNIVPEEGIKAPVRMATTANITLSGLQTIDGVSGAENDRVLVGAQTDASENGIYVMQLTAWVRASDWDDNTDVVSGMLITSSEGTLYSGVVWKATFTGVFSIDTTLVSMEASPTPINSDKRYGPLFATVAAMTAANPVSVDGLAVNLVAGMSVSTQGKLTSSDGISIRYVVESGDTSNGSTRVLAANGTTLVLQPFKGWYILSHAADHTGVVNANAALRACLDLGPTFGDKGTFLLSAFEHASSDTLVCIGKDCLFTATSGVIFAYGAIDAGAFTTGNVTFSAAANPTVADVSITMTTAADADKYSVGEIIALWSEEGYSDGFSTFKPLFQQLVSVRSVNGTTGVVELDDTIYKTYTGTEFRVTKGSEITNSEGTANGFTRDITTGNFAVSTPNDSWTRWGGTYNTHIFNIDLVDSNGAFVNNGFAKSRLENVSGLISDRGMDLAYFSHDSYLSFGPLSCFDGSRVIGAYKFAEGAHDNTVINQSVDLPLFTGGGDRALLVGFAIGSSNNKLSGGVIRAGNFTDVINVNNLESGVTVLPHDGNILDDIDIRVTKSTNLIKTVALAKTDRTGLLIGDGVKIHSDNNITNCILMETSGVKIRGAALSAPTIRAINIPAGVIDGEISKVAFSGTPNFATIDAGSSVLIEDNIYGDDSLMRGKVNFTSATAIQSTSSANVVLTRVFPAGTLLAGDVIKIEAFLQMSGAAAAKNVAIRVNGTNFATYSTAAATTSAHLKGSFNLISLVAQRMYLDGQDGTNSSLGRGAAFIDTAITAITLEIAMWVDNAADSITPDSVTMEPFRDV